MSRWFMDTEFCEDGKGIDLISIALVSDDGHEYYAVSTEFDAARCNDWVRANVLPKLPPREDPHWKSRRVIADEIKAMLLPDAAPEPEIWGYFCDYDWVVFCWLFGIMNDLPKGMPYWCRDLKQFMEAKGVKRENLPPDGTDEHSALADARWIRDAHRIVSEAQT